MTDIPLRVEQLLRAALIMMCVLVPRCVPSVRRCWCWSTGPWRISPPLPARPQAAASSQPATSCTSPSARRLTRAACGSCRLCSTISRRACALASARPGCATSTITQSTWVTAAARPCVCSSRRGSCTAWFGPPRASAGRVSAAARHRCRCRMWAAWCRRCRRRSAHRRCGC
jgi:hypothetical protein